MVNRTDSTHAKNLANFKLLNEINAGHGELYKPVNSLIKLVSMQELAAIATDVQGNYEAVTSPYKNATVARIIAFKPLSKLVSRVMYCLKSSGAPVEMYNQARTLARLIRGQRASAKNKPDPVEEGTETVPAPKQISASHMGFDNRISNFGKFIQLLAGIEEYNPNEDDLKIEALTIMREDLIAKNDTYTQVEVPYNNARIARDQVFYTKIEGLCDVGQSSKNYIRSVFGVSSPQFKQVSKIQFKKNK